jgi:hypothetical protein
VTYQQRGHTKLEFFRVSGEPSECALIAFLTSLALTIATTPVPVGN